MLQLLVFWKSPSHQTLLLLFQMTFILLAKIFRTLLARSVDCLFFYFELLKFQKYFLEKDVTLYLLRHGNKMKILLLVMVLMILTLNFWKKPNLKDQRLLLPRRLLFFSFNSNIFIVEWLCWFVSAKFG